MRLEYWGSSGGSVEMDVDFWPWWALLDVLEGACVGSRTWFTREI